MEGNVHKGLVKGLDYGLNKMAVVGMFVQAS